jgi:transaldolase
MTIFLDTANLEEIERFHRMGIIRGVTTNPTIMLKDGIVGGIAAIKSRSREIAGVIAPYPLSVEVMTNEPGEILRQALAFREWAENILVKVTIHGPEGELENLEIIHQLESAYDVRVNVTAMMSAQQCLLASLAGASYVSIFGGRVNNMGYNACDEITKLRQVLDRLGLDSQIIVGSTREILNVIEWLVAGAHVVTVAPHLLEGMLIHPYTKETVRMFMDDAAKAEEMLSLMKTDMVLTARDSEVR